MRITGFAISVIAAMGLAFSAFAGDAPGVGKGNGPTPSFTDLGLSLVDNYGDTYSLTAHKTGSRPPSGTISGSSVACSGGGSYSVSGTFLGTTVHLDNHLVSGGSCQDFVVNCVVNAPTRTCAGSFTNADGGSGPITLSEQ